MNLILWHVPKSLNKLRSIKLLSNFEITWTDSFYEPGKFNLTMPADDDIVPYLQDFCLLSKPASNSIGSNYEDVMIVEKVIMTEDENEGRVLSLTGHKADAIFGYRTLVRIRQQGNEYNFFPFRCADYNPPQALHIVQAMFTLLFKESEYQARNISWLHISSNITGTYDEIPQVFNGENFLDVVNDWRQSYKFGIKARIVQARYALHDPVDPEEWLLTFLIYEPTDRTAGEDPVILSAYNGDIYQTEYNYDSTNVISSVLAVGEKEDPPEEFDVIEDAESSVYRSEVFSDLTSISDEDLTEDVETLVEEQARAQFRGPRYKISLKETPNSHFHVNEDYFLGDTIVIRDAFGNYGKVRCTQVTENYDRDGHTLIPTFDEWEGIPSVLRCRTRERFITRDNQRIIVKGE